MAKVTLKIEAEERETELVKTMTGKDVQEASVEMDIPVELMELTALAAQALPLIKTYLGKMERTKPVIRLNGEVVEP
jgi:hypothetical protein